MPLHRRDFLKSAAVAAAATALPLTESRALDVTARDARTYQELRAYRLKPGVSHTLLDGYLEKALIPALNKRGVQNVGVFTEPAAKDGPAVWTLIQHRSLDAMSAINDAINADPAVLAAGAEYLRVGKADAAFDRIDTWLLIAFAGLPRLMVPALTREKKARIFELRIYESFSEVTALKKVAMFNAGEIEVMQQVGLSPVFYGQALVGRDLPQLSYMLCSPDRATHDTNWKAFLDHPVWKRLLADPQYADTVSKITSRFLEPTPYSQL
jgi:NIPSNAP/TAT (twin-arginine translocation) pathway signal sequence